MPRQLAHRPRGLDPGGPAADGHEGQQLAATLLVGLALGLLESHEDLLAHGERVPERLEPHGVLRPGVVSEPRRLRTRRDDEIVEADLVAVAEDDLPPVVIDVHHLAHQDARVGIAPEDGADRDRDVAGGEARRRDLVEERLKEVMVFAVDQRDAHVLHLAQGAGHGETAETTPHDHDVLLPLHDRDTRGAGSPCRVRHPPVTVERRARRRYKPWRRQARR